VDELPPPANVDCSFAGYHAKTEVAGRAILYTRSMEVKELTVPVDKVDELRKFYRAIAANERGTAILKPVGADK
jgi:hypothetical protein